MRKVLLATTALVGVALTGAAHAAAPTSPISLNVGGYVDFVAGAYHESQATANGGTGVKRGNHDFETEGRLNIDATGKAANGMQYGADLGLWNGREGFNGWAPVSSSATLNVNSAYVWLSGAFGKAMFGDSRGATDLFVYAPTVGEGQIDGRYNTDFTDATTLSHFQPSGIDNTERSTNVTYYTPRVGNDMHKVQLGVTYIPQYDSAGTGVTLYKTSAYQNVVKGAVQYMGNFHPVSVVASADIINGNGQTITTAPTSNTRFGTVTGTFKDFTSYGLGAQALWNGLTVGGSYVDKGSYGALKGTQNKAQDVWTFGAKYEFDKVAVAANYLTGKGYDNLLAFSTGNKYVRNFDAYGAGASYTWFPGLTTNLDGVLFTQKTDATTANHDDGYVVLVSEKLTF